MKKDLLYLLHNIHPSECAYKVDCAKDDLGDKRVLNTNRLEDRCSILSQEVSFNSGLPDGRTYVEEVVGTGQLLEHLQSHTQKRSVELLVPGLEAINPASLDRRLVLDGGPHVRNLRECQKQPITR